MVCVVVSGPQVPKAVSVTVKLVPGPTKTCVTVWPVVVLSTPEFGSPKFHCQRVTFGLVGGKAGWMVALAEKSTGVPMQALVGEKA